MSGCRYGKCLFCDFRRDKLEIYGLEDIERQLSLLRVIEDERNRMHFLGCNPFFLNTEILEFFCDMVRVYLPKITEISMYARADDINAKSDEELLRLRAAGITDLHVGLESGSDAILSFHNKVWCIALKLWENTPLYDMAQNGEFEALTPMEVLKEEREMVSRLEMTKPCRYIDSTVLQKYTVSATLPQGKEGLLRAIDRMIDQEGALL